MVGQDSEMTVSEGDVILAKSSSVYYVRNVSMICKPKDVRLLIRHMMSKSLEPSMVE